MKSGGWDMKKDKSPSRRGCFCLNLLISREIGVGDIEGLYFPCLKIGPIK